MEPSSKFKLVFETGSKVERLMGRLTLELMEGRVEGELGWRGQRGRSALKGQTLSMPVVH